MSAPRDPNRTVAQQVAEWFALGDDLFCKHSEFLAVGYYQWITELDPQNGRAWRMLGLCCLVGMGGEKNALHALQKAVEINPSDEAARRALENLRADLARNPNIIDQGNRQFEELTRDLVEKLKQPMENSSSSSEPGGQSVENISEEILPPTKGSAKEVVRSWSRERQMFIADALLNGSQYKEALEIYEMVLQSSPDYLDAQINRASCLLRLGQPDMAARLLAELTTQHPTAVEIWHNLGAVYADMHQTEKARSAYRKAADLGSQRPETWMQLATCHYELSPKENAEQALAWLNKAVAVAPEFGPAHGVRGRILDDLRRDKEALMAYDRCLQLAPGSRGEMFGRALVLLRMKRVEEAKRQFEEIIAVDPNIPGAWCNLAVCCSILGQMKEAMKAITTAVDIFPENSSVAYMWCDLRRRQKGGDPKLQMTQQEADRLHHELHSELYKLRVENDSSNAELWSALGEEYLALDDFANAETAFLKATEYGTTHATDWYNLAFFPHQRGEAKKVVVLTEKAIALGFADPGLWGLRGIAFSQIGNLFEARRCLQNSVSLDVDNPSNIEILRDIEAQIERIRSSPEFRVLTVTGHCGKCGGLLSVDMTVIGYECSCPNCKDPVPASPLLGEIRSAFAQTGIDVPPD